MLTKAMKSVVLSLVPDKALLLIKKIHYAKKLKGVDEGVEKDLGMVKNLVSSGDVALDLGANIGVYTKFLSMWAGAPGKVYSFEPVPSTFKILQWNIKTLALANVRSFNYALSDAEREAVMEIPRYGSGGDNFYQARIRQVPSSSRLKRVSVKRARLDALLADASDRVAFIKCDVEGHELSCLRGALNVIEKSRPSWLIEISGNPDEADSPAWKTTELLRSYQYEPYWLDGGKLRKRRRGDRSVNYFFLTEKHLKGLGPHLWP